jgi:hypothetical protein
MFCLLKANRRDAPIVLQKVKNKLAVKFRDAPAESRLAIQRLEPGRISRSPLFPGSSGAC